MNAATKPPKEVRATDRVLEALSTVAALLDQTINEVHSLDSEFQQRLLQGVHETEESLQRQAAQHLEQALTTTRGKLQEQFNNSIAELSQQWETERESLHSELARSTQTTAQWEADRARLNGEIERLARVQAATQVEAERAIAAMKASSAAKPSPSELDEALTREIARVEKLIKEISALIDDPTSELSIIIRKNVERAELNSYLKGIRFALNGSNSK